jgi:hypothetical protein
MMHMYAFGIPVVPLVKWSKAASSGFVSGILKSVEPAP